MHLALAEKVSFVGGWEALSHMMKRLQLWWVGMTHSKVCSGAFSLQRCCLLVGFCEVLNRSLPDQNRTKWAENVKLGWQSFCLCLRTSVCICKVTNSNRMVCVWEGEAVMDECACACVCVCEDNGASLKERPNESSGHCYFPRQWFAVPCNSAFWGIFNL